jgi:hypothetical protein
MLRVHCSGLSFSALTLGHVHCWDDYSLAYGVHCNIRKVPSKQLNRTSRCIESSKVDMDIGMSGPVFEQAGRRGGCWRYIEATHGV